MMMLRWALEVRMGRFCHSNGQRLAHRNFLAESVRTLMGEKTRVLHTMTVSTAVAVVMPSVALTATASEWCTISRSQVDSKMG